MFRTSFSKYLTAFIIVIFLSFSILSGIITTLVHNYAMGDTEDRLGKECSIVVDMILENGVEDKEKEIVDLAHNIKPMINLNTDFYVIVTDANGDILLSTAHSESSSIPEIDLSGSIGNITISGFEKQKEDNGDVGYIYNGTLDESLDDQYMVYAKPVVDKGETKYYVMTMASTNKESNFVSTTRRVVINSSIWVMLAAVIVAYFITERIVHPMRTMTAAAEKFAKGDFSARVRVKGKRDEVAKLGRAFNEMADSLESLDNMRNTFLASVSHELRTPMTTISGFIDGINSGAIPPEKHEYYLGVISAEVHRLSRLVSQLLDIARLESGEKKYTFSDFDIAEVARLILISFEQKIDAKRLDVEFDAEYDCMYVRADKDAVYQVLYNLCHNAIKFAREEGKLRIRITRVTDSQFKVAVYDQGDVISEEDEKLIFERFYKTDKSRGLDKSGVGLGLYISKTIIDAHGETIGVDSSSGDGCEFWFTLTEGTQPNKRNQLPDINK